MSSGPDSCLTLIVRFDEDDSAILIFTFHILDLDVPFDSQREKVVLEILLIITKYSTGLM